MKSSWTFGTRHTHTEIQHTDSEHSVGFGADSLSASQGAEGEGGLASEVYGQRVLATKDFGCPVVSRWIR
jgi:hypothetical protein